MKKFGITLFLLFILLGASYGIVQGKVGKDFVRDRITRSLQEAGYEVQIGQIEGVLPHQIRLKEVIFSGKEGQITIKELEFRPVLWRFLKKEIALNHIVAQGVSVSEGSPFDFRGTFRLNAKRALLKGTFRDWHFVTRFDRMTNRGLFEIENRELDWKEKGEFLYQNNRVEGKIASATFQLTLSPTFSAAAQFQQGTIEWRPPSIELTLTGAQGDLHMSGTFKESLHIETLGGQFFGHPFALQKEALLEYGKDYLRLREAEILIDGATALFSMERSENETQLHVQLEEFPLFGAKLNLDAAIHEKNQLLAGELKGVLVPIDPIDATGTWSGHLSGDLLSLKGDFSVHGEPLSHVDIAVPVKVSLWPFTASILWHKEAKGEISLHGRVEEFLDFLDFGPHRLEGLCEAQLKFSHNLYRPLVDGKIVFSEGSYENYYTGTELRNIEAVLIAEKNNLFLRSFTAHDQGDGTLSARGQMELVQSSLYPFELDVKLDHLQFAQIDLVTAQAGGQIRIEGNQTSALAKGHVTIEQTQLSIPDHIPKPLPHLQVVYRNETQPIVLAPPPVIVYPLYLDLNVITSDPLSIGGRGLTSSWQGEFHVGGTYSAPAAKGTLKLMEGEFSFSNRNFQLIEGALSLSGTEQEMPYLNLAGSIEIKGVTIVARLNGSLNNPQITLQSTPPLPLGSILSYLLFGQDLSEISGFQALELASSLASLAGTGPDIMESTRRSLGIDRLRIIADPNQDGTVALEVGKYVTDGVLVTFTQGTEDSAPNISVEVELKNNFVFQIESDQHQEQGKFTLKWSRNY